MATATIKEAMLHGSGNFLQTEGYYDTWKTDMHKYQETRTAWKDPVEPYVKRTFKDMKQKETSYNPITQKFKDPVVEQHIERVEKDSFIEVLAKNKDRALRYEQTFNVINFENKLKGLEDRADYPKDKPWYFRQRAETNAEYNILSNIPLQEHHYAGPDHRPPAKEEKKQKIKKMTTTGLRDYNIITGRYLELHEDKLKADQEIQRAEAAYKYW
jgi:hypothetical protein